MDVHARMPLLGGLSPAQFMRRHWEKKPLLVRQAWPGIQPPVTRAQVFQLAGSEDVESRLVVRSGGGWQVRQGPLPRRALPPVAQPQWTLLVQGLDLHVDAARALLQPFRFIPEARLDDLMISWASDGGGVGPHVDAYDVFLLQVAGRRRGGCVVGHAPSPACSQPSSSQACTTSRAPALRAAQARASSVRASASCLISRASRPAARNDSPLMKT